MDGMRTSIAATLAAVLAAGAAHAVPGFGISGGALFDDATNDFLWIDSDVTEGGILMLSEPAQVTVEYIGKEAGFPATEFWFGALVHPGGTLVATTNSGTPVREGSLTATPFPPPGITRGLAPYTAFADAGAVPFYFRVPGNDDAIVPNGGGAEGDIAFWWKTDSGALENVVYLLLDDSGGFNPGEPSDNDHDDMIVRLTALPVPEPGSGVLVLLGLVGCAADSRRRILLAAKRAR
jgi:hypothetical protein